MSSVIDLGSGRSNDDRALNDRMEVVVVSLVHNDTCVNEVLNDDERAEVLLLRRALVPRRSAAVVRWAAASIMSDMNIIILLR